MKVAVISDIHGNLRALRAVVAAERDADMWLCAGDLVGYYLDPEEVCREIRRLGAYVVRGNHDAYVTGALEPSEANAGVYRIRECRQSLSGEMMKWLVSLPVGMDFRIDNLSLRMRHASPWDEATYIYPDSEPLFNRLQIEPSEIMILGHTHHPLLKQIGGGWLLNPGSVGQPRDGRSSAAYAVIDTCSRKIEHKRAEYDTTAYAQELRQAGLDNRVIRYFTPGDKPPV